MIQEFQIQNFFSIRERQTLSFLPTNDDKMRSQYLYEVAEGEIGRASCRERV